MGIRQKINEVRTRDEARPGFPAERWLVLGAGLLVMRTAGKSRGFLGRMVGRAVGSALIARSIGPRRRGRQTGTRQFSRSRHYRRGPRAARPCAQLSRCTAIESGRTE